MSNKKTTEQFIEESKAVYGDEYDYSETIYRGRFKPVTLRCALHGTFTVATASGHLRNHVGCTLCKRFKKGMESIKEHYDINKYTFEDISLHTTTKVKEQQDLFVRVICKEHGLCREDHLRNIANGSIKNLCRSCLKETIEKRREDKKELKKRSVTIQTYTPINKLSLENVKERCIEIFGTDISFDKLVYINSKTKFTLQCNKHKHYFNVVLKHIRSGEFGCRFCKKDKYREESERMFLQNCLERYGTKYDYSNMNFINMSIKIKIGCPLHRNI